MLWRADAAGAPGLGEGVAFNGTQEGVVSLGSESSLGTLTAGFSLVAWVYPTDQTGKNRIIGSLQPNGWGFGLVDVNIIEFTTFGVKDYRATFDFPVETWTHVALAFDAQANATFYVNGETVGTDPAGGPARQSADEFFIGRASSAAEYFSGSLDEVGVFTGVLSADEVVSIFSEGVEFPEPPRSERPVFRRGDCNNDGRVDVSDAACALNWLFATAPDPGCLATLNTNGDDDVNIADPVSLLNFLFGGGEPPADPFPDCGPGTLPADAETGCANPPSCQ